MRTTMQDHNFIAEVIHANTNSDTEVDRGCLDDAIDWIQRKLSPQDVFTEKQLKEWAYENFEA